MVLPPDETIADPAADAAAKATSRELPPAALAAAAAEAPDKAVPPESAITTAPAAAPAEAAMPVFVPPAALQAAAVMAPASAGLANLARAIVCAACAAAVTMWAEDALRIVFSTKAAVDAACSTVDVPESAAWPIS
jgi:hypothetical protein